VILTFGGNQNNNYPEWLESSIEILIVAHKRVATVLKAELSSSLLPSKRMISSPIWMIQT
jgi:hypothetical protein